ncbi:MAG: sigma-70 family RNA polymerase sigma factor [Planctomycetes bacterium]|nr:sigma-70 family RNA polymerase sigma factor [Planctomycetota bacterium]
MTKHLTHAQLDSKLDILAKQALAAFAAGSADTFVPAARKLVDALDKSGTAIEVSDPQSWRRPVKSLGSGQRLALSQQFRAEVDSIVPLDRDAEQRLARRIEFARLRLERALEETGVAPDLLPKGVGTAGLGLQGVVGGCTLPARVCRRWFELHALRSEMVERNLWLVGVNVERYSHTSASQADLIQEGCAALFRAVDGFDWRRGLLFRTYAVHWLNQAFRSYLYNFSNTVRVPVYLQKALKHVNDAKASLGDQNAAASAIAGQAGMDQHLVESAMGAVHSIRSLDATYDDDGGGRLRDFLSAPESEEGPYNSALEEHTLAGSIEDALAALSERERFVIERRFGINQPREFTLAEVAHELKVSLERVRQIQVRALGKLRTPNLRRVIDPFLN